MTVVGGHLKILEKEPINDQKNWPMSPKEESNNVWDKGIRGAEKIYGPRGHGQEAWHDDSWGVDQERLPTESPKG